MKKNYIAPNGEYIRFDVEDVLTKRLPIKNYLDDGDAPDASVGEGGGFGGGGLD